jgi:hypothetical protein
MMPSRRGHLRERGRLVREVQQDQPHDDDGAHACQPQGFAEPVVEVLVEQMKLPFESRALVQIPVEQVVGLRSEHGPGFGLLVHPPNCRGT